MSRFLFTVYVYSIGFAGAKGLVWLSFYVVYLPVLYLYYSVSSTYRAATLVYNVVIEFTDGWVRGWVAGVHPSIGHSRRWTSIVVGEDICKEIIITIETRLVRIPYRKNPIEIGVILTSAVDLSDRNYQVSLCLTAIACWNQCIPYCGGYNLLCI